MRIAAALGFGRSSRARLLLVLAGAAWQFWPTQSVSGKPSVAVLPFDNYGGDEATGRLADGLTEDIITDLARFPEFQVIARNSTEPYRASRPARTKWERRLAQVLWSRAPSSARLTA